MSGGRVVDSKILGVYEDGGGGIRTRPARLPSLVQPLHVSNSHLTRGTFMLVGSCVCYASWYILQVKLLKVFPSKYTATLITCITASLQSAAIGLFMDRSKAAWRLQWNLELITIVSAGARSTAATFCLLTWSIAKRGPTYALCSIL
ncbi:hypothetical protein F3Y22_tig00109926pilonHSYRG00023 [Hibiscus syriacus]|uniref:WAT1-related protein n=1 Tax=Hibiscus syriacus TaxID=106335 RepID=A0A6A3BW70_HIBSY|nr:hypothetical protein F3Y22_tig00109926pilonHSYRG00023 [Hibiscus syriacus]